MAKLLVLTGAGTALSAYIATLAGQSPSPLLQDSIGGPILCVGHPTPGDREKGRGSVQVGAYTVAFGVLAYLRTVMAELVRGSATAGSGRRLFWYGAATQAGSFAGSLIAFCIINLPPVPLFTAFYPTCPSP